MSQPTATCENCRFWREATNQQRSVCKRRAPVFLRLHTDNYPDRTAEWPETWRGDWCGEHSPVPAPDAQTPAQGREGEKAKPDTPEG